MMGGATEETVAPTWTEGSHQFQMHVFDLSGGRRKENLQALELNLKLSCCCANPLGRKMLTD